ncbi:MAG TPA: DNA sulfur modification protein DndD [Gammaproteobacteria bacterium]|nr:DNA sulfur modification protein DndD [Gammaproteobacteria bacterium]
MIFDEIKIYNLFSYYGEQVFDLRKPSEGRNIVLISGRNGFGKTSLLNSVKLLFGGVTESLRRSVQRGRMLSERQYVLGAGEEWLGMMNRRAYHEGLNQCGIQIIWQEKLGEVQVSRRWVIKGEKVHNELIIKASFLEERITDSHKAQDFLNERLPLDYLPFFFFDGEKIQELAEANAVIQQQHIERLLNISPINTLRDYLSKVISDWKREALDEKTLTELSKLESELESLDIQYTTKEHLSRDMGAKIEELEERIQQLERVIDRMQAFRYQRDELLLKQDQLRLEEQRVELQSKIAETLPRDIPLLANLNLVKRTLTQLSELLETRSHTQVDHLLKELVANLPDELFDKPPYPKTPLDDQQRHFYQDRLVHLLQNKLISNSIPLETVLRLEPSRIKSILGQLQRYTLEEVLQERINELPRLQQIKTQLIKIDEKLDTISGLSADERTRYQQHKVEQKKYQNELINQKAEFKKLLSEMKGLETEISKQKAAIRQQQEQVNLNEQTRQKVELAKALREFFSQFKDRLKDKRKKEIEQAINHYFPILMTAHKMIHHIRVTSDFELRYENAEGYALGINNFSSGMRQLIATTLLWALKEVSGKNIPLIIDTPLARIDREHQNNLLRQYYPNVAQQVIILPTDSELDVRKYEQLKAYIYKEYCLYNAQGDTTEVKEQAIYIGDFGSTQ